MNTYNKSFIIFALFILSLILFLPYSSEGKVIYTDIMPDTVISCKSDENFAYYSLDIDNDGTTDFNLSHYKAGLLWFAVEASCDSSAGIKNIACLENSVPIAYNAGDSIEDSIYWVNTIDSENVTALILNSTHIVNFEWNPGNDYYLGVRFKMTGISDSWYYGWVRINIVPGMASFIIKDYAYNDEPEKQILAGDGITGVNFNDTGNEPVKIITGNDHIEIINPYKITYSIDIYDYLGRVIINCGYNNFYNILNLEKGLYFTTIAYGNRLYQKKLVVN
jgi:hypothetical protein